MSRLFYFLLILTSELYAQEPSYYVLGKDLFDGVKLYSIIQDDDSSIWIASENGLYNYNSIHFKQVLVNETKSSVLFGLTKNNKGEIFCHNLVGQIFQIKNKKIVSYFTVPKEHRSPDLKILFDESGNLLIRTNSKLLTITKDKRITIENQKGNLLTKYNDSIYHLKTTANYSKVLLRKSNQDYPIAHFNKKKLANLQSQMFRLNNTFFYYNEKKTEDAFYKLINNSLKTVSLPFINHPNFKIYQTKKELWFCDIQKGVYKVKNKSLENIPNTQRWFKKSYISGVMVDNEKNTWLLTFYNGIIIIPNNNIKNKKYTLNSNISGISKNNKTLYIGTIDGNIFKLKNNIPKHFFKTKKDRLEHFSVLKNENLIVTNTSFYNDTKTKKGISFNRSEVLLNDTLYCAIYNGIYAFDINSKKANKLTNKRTYKILYDSISKQFWLLSSAGLSTYKNGKETPVKINNRQLITKDIIQVENEIWATTPKGIVIFKDTKVDRIITVKNGLYTNNIKHLIYEKPNIYLYSKKGIQQYNINSSSFKNIRNSDGLLKNILQFEVLNDTVYTLNSDGLSSFIFNHVSDSIPKYQTKIPKVTCNGNKTIKQYCVLKPDENNIEFSFLTTTFKYRKNLSYQYQLKGFEKKTIKTKDNQNYVNYSNLPAGTYTFVADSFIDKQKNKSATFTFTIEKYWYQKTVFKIVSLVFIVLILFSIFRYRRQILKDKHEKETMLKRLAKSSLTSLKAQMNPHFLFNAMNSIQTLILTKKNKEAYQYLTELSNLVRENLKMSDVSFVSFEDELNLIKRYLELEKLRFGDTFTYEIKNSVNKSTLSIPSMIIQPFIENAIKHGLLHRKTNRSVIVEFKELEKTMCCIVTDNGIGRSASQKMYKNRKYKSFSTDAIQKRFSILREYYKLDINFNYEDLYIGDKASGTKVIIKFPFTDEQN